MAHAPRCLADPCLVLPPVSAAPLTLGFRCVRRIWAIFSCNPGVRGIEQEAAARCSYLLCSGRAEEATRLASRFLGPRASRGVFADAERNPDTNPALLQVCVAPAGEKGAAAAAANPMPRAAAV